MTGLNWYGAVGKSPTVLQIFPDLTQHALNKRSNRGEKRTVPYGDWTAIEMARLAFSRSLTRIGLSTAEAAEAWTLAGEPILRLRIEPGASDQPRNCCLGVYRRVSDNRLGVLAFRQTERGIFPDEASLILAPLQAAGRPITVIEVDRLFDAVQRAIAQAAPDCPAMRGMPDVAKVLH